MRCLVVSDLHYTLKQFDWVLNNAASYDVVIIAGDHLDIVSPVDIQAQITVILAYLKRLCAKTRVLVCSGNHDLDAFNLANEKYAKWILRARQFGVPTDEDSTELGETLFTICPWWDGLEGCEKVFEQLQRDSQKFKKKWVWIYHSPPDQSPTSWGGKKYFGDSRLMEWIGRFSPDLVVSGHIHQSPFKDGGSWVDRIGKTWVFNPGRQMGPSPTHIVWDSDQQEALWFSLAGVESVSMDQPLVRPLAPLTELPNWFR